MAIEPEINEITDDEIDELVNRIAKPIYVLRFAEFGKTRINGSNHSAQVRAKNARNEIRKIISWLLYDD